jgi:arylsulfatase A-like enzyme/Tfp pilus assembly protein PilF
MKIKPFAHLRFFIQAAAAAVLLLIAWLGYRTFISSFGRIDNILLISIDTCRADFLSCYGYPKKTTPNIDKIAAQGILFENVIAPIPLTLPSHSSMLTGTTPPYHGVHDNNGYRLGESNVTVGELLKENGFMTGAIVSSFVLDSEFGLNQGFETYYDNFNTDLDPRRIAERKGGETTEHAKLWLQKHHDERFFLFLHYFDPHHPYTPPEPFRPGDHINFRISQIANYAGEIAYVDHCIGQIIDKLKELDLYDSTLLIITSDHGEMLGEHGETTHGYSIYQAALKVPLIVKLPGKRSPRRISQIVGLVDIAPTICSLLGIETQQKFHGIDLLRYISKKGPGEKRYIYCESFLPTIYKDCNFYLGVVSDGWKYIQTTRPELYDLNKDPGELYDIANEQKHRARILQDQLKRILEEQLRPDNSECKIALSKESKARLESLGYVGGLIVEDSFEFDQGKKDPKDLIGFHRCNATSKTAFAAGQYDIVKELCKQMLAEDPTFQDAYYYLGSIAYEEREFEKVVEYLSRHLELGPQNYETLNNLGLAFFHLNRHDDAVKSYNRAIELEPGFMEAHYNLGREFCRVGKFDKAIAHFRKALQLAPGDDDVIRELDRALTARQQITEGALKHYRDILRDNPNSPDAHYNLANIYLRQGKNDLALQHCTKALEANPESVSLRVRLANMLLELDRVQSALAEYYRALHAEPDSVNILNSIAWILATSGDKDIQNPADAVKYAQQACELTDYKKPETLDTLAAALASAGKFDQARETAQKAIALADSENQKDLAKRIRLRLELYQAGRAYVSPD